MGNPHVWGHNCVAKAPLWEFLGISVFEMLWGAKIVVVIVLFRRALVFAEQHMRVRQTPNPTYFVLADDI